MSAVALAVASVPMKACELVPASVSASVVLVPSTVDPRAAVTVGKLDGASAHSVDVWAARLVTVSVAGSIFSTNGLSYGGTYSTPLSASTGAPMYLLSPVSRGGQT